MRFLWRVQVKPKEFNRTDSFQPSVVLLKSKPARFVDIEIDDKMISRRFGLFFMIPDVGGLRLGVGAEVS